MLTAVGLPLPGGSRTLWIALGGIVRRRLRFSPALGNRLWGKNDGHGAGPLVGLGRIIRYRPDRGSANDAVQDRTVEPLPDPAHAAGAHATLDRLEELLLQGEEEVLVELLTPFRIGALHSLQQIAPCPLAGSAAQVEQ